MKVKGYKRADGTRVPGYTRTSSHRKKGMSYKRKSRKRK